jgi:hypothetical protein
MTLDEMRAPDPGNRLHAHHPPRPPTQNRRSGRNDQGRQFWTPITPSAAQLSTPIHSHESITTTRLYAETTVAALKRSFDRITDPAAHALIAGIRQRRGDDAAVLAAELLARRRAERVSTVDA